MSARLHSYPSTFPQQSIPSRRQNQINHIIFKTSSVGKIETLYRIQYLTYIKCSLLYCSTIPLFSICFPNIWNVLEMPALFYSCLSFFTVSNNVFDLSSSLAFSHFSSQLSSPYTDLRPWYTQISIVIQFFLSLHLPFPEYLSSSHNHILTVDTAILTIFYQSGTVTYSLNLI